MEETSQPQSSPTFSRSEQTLREQAKNVWMFGVPDLEDFFYPTAQVAASELAKYLDWINLNGKIEFELNLTNSVKFKANCKKTGGNCRIDISLSCIRALLGIASRMVIPPDFAMILGPELYLNQRHSKLPDKEWDPKEEPSGDISFLTWPQRNEVSRIVADALVLIFLHEVSHAFAGHLDVEAIHKSQSSEILRAAESEADAGAGTLFLAYIFESSTTESPQQPDKKEYLDRLFLASICMHISQHIDINRNFTKPFNADREYHLPLTRNKCVLQGAIIALLAPQAPDLNFREIYDEIRERVSPALTYLPASIAHMLEPGEPNQAQDESDLVNISYKLLVDKIHPLTEPFHNSYPY